MAERKFKIAEHSAGRPARTYIIAEAGVNHNGNPALALKMVDIAASAGADAVKFQMFRASALVTCEARQAMYQKKNSPAKTQYEMLRRLELAENDFKKLAARAREKGIAFLATPFDEASADFLDRLKVPAFKIASSEITNHGFLAHIARKRKPVILSTGMSDIGEIRSALAVLRKNGARDIAIMHCTSDYPCRPEYANLSAITTLRKEFGLPTGFSDHTEGSAADAAAVALGATIIEKHFTPDKKMRGPDHAASLDPAGLVDMIKTVRTAERMMGNGRKRLMPCERDAALSARKSIVAATDIPAGAKIMRDMICVKRPGTGIPPFRMEFVMGSTAVRKIRKDTPLRLSDIRNGR